MIEAVTAVARADAVAIAVAAGANARRTLEGRQKRMRWLDALRVANGEPLPLDDEERDEAILEDNRRRIRAALDTIEELRGLDGEEAEPEAEAARKAFRRAKSPASSGPRRTPRCVRRPISAVPPSARFSAKEKW